MKGQNFLLAIKVRPHLEEFLETLSNYYHIVIWSEMKLDLVNKVVRLIPGLQSVKRKLSRENCEADQFGFKKSLQRI